MSRLLLLRIGLLALALLCRTAPGLAAPSPTPPREEKRVLLLSGENKDNPGQQLAEQGIREVLHSTTRFAIQLYTEYLDVSRFGARAQARAMADFLRRKYAGLPIHAIITVYPAALEFLLAEQPPQFPEVPIIAAAITWSDAERLDRSPARRRVTAVVGGDNITGLVETALRLRPTTKHFALIAGTSPTDAVTEQMFRRGLEAFGGRIDVIDLTKLPLEETLVRVATLPPDTLVLFGSMFRDGAGQSLVSPEVLTRIAQASNAPVFGFPDTYLGFGIVGGRLASFKAHGQEAARLALRVLAGESPASIPFGGEQAYVMAFDWRELQRWHIPESVIPAGAEIRYRMPSVWEEYRRGIIGVMAVMTLETALILGLLLNVRTRRKAERSLRGREKELVALTGRLVNTQEKELRRLSRDLHDDLTQRLAALAIDAGMLAKAVRPLEPDASQQLAALKTGLIELSDEVHALSRHLHPSILDDLGLVQAIRSECDIFSRRTGIAVSFAPGNLSLSIPMDRALCLYRVLQEGLQNIAKHAKASDAQVVLQGSADGVHLSIRDSGIGFDVDSVAGKGAIGLSSIRERVRLVDGTVAVRSEPGKGTEITVIIPVKEDACPERAS